MKTQLTKSQLLSELAEAREEREALAAEYVKRHAELVEAREENERWNAAIDRLAAERERLTDRLREEVALSNGRIEQLESRFAEVCEENERLRGEMCVCEKCGHRQAEPNWCHECSHRVSMPDWARSLMTELETAKIQADEAESQLADTQAAGITDERIERMASWLAIRDNYNPNAVEVPQWWRITESYRVAARRALEVVLGLPEAKS